MSKQYIDLSNLICGTFRETIENIITCKVDRAVLKGGRNSTKSQSVSEAIVIGCMVYRASAVAIIKHANKIDERLVSTFRDSIKYLGIEKYWKLRRAPFEYVLLDKNGKETDKSIKFTGADNPELIKSYKPRSGGGFRYIWFEEATNFNGINEINNISDTMGRGDGDHCTILTYNPPKQTSNWVNKEYEAPCGKVIGFEDDIYKEELHIEINGEQHKILQLVHHSSYLDVIRSGHTNWLGISFIARAEQAKKDNNIYYRWNYLGEVIGTEANVFTNIVSWQYDETMHFYEIDRGLDVSNGGKDPWAYGNWFYDKRNNSLYCLDEFKLNGGASIEQVAVNIKDKNKMNMNFYIDSAVPTFRRLLQNQGLNVIPAKKGNDSVAAGILWLQSLSAIYIDKMRCPETYKEFKGYEYLIDKDDNITSELVDANNHFIDACRYSLCMKIKYM